MNMIEKVARAMALVIAKRHDNKNEDGGYDVNSWMSEARYEEAKAAIEAMRIPTEAMVKDAISARPYLIKNEIEPMYQAMIDAALEE